MKFTTIGSILLMTLVSMTSAASFWAGRRSMPSSTNGCEAAHVNLCSFKAGDSIQHRMWMWGGVVAVVGPLENPSAIVVRFSDGSLKYQYPAEWTHKDCE